MVRKANLKSKRVGGQPRKVQPAMISKCKNKSLKKDDFFSSQQYLKVD